jgi:AcrR family transcriptional regulator
VEARERILAAAADLLAEAAGEPVSTRAICARADVGPPTLYHHFGDKDGLFEAVVAERFEEYLSAARAVPASGDPVADLRRGWDFQLDFGRRNPAFYVLMYAKPPGGRTRKAAAEAHADLVALLQDVAGTGRLRGELELAADTIEAALVGATLQVINSGEQADALRAANQVRDAVLAALLTTDTSGTGESGATEPNVEETAPALVRVATQFAALLARSEHPLSKGEVVLLNEWVGRITATG